MDRPFDNGQSFGDPFVSSNPPESSQLPHTPPNRPRSRPPVPTITPPDFSRIQNQGGVLTGSGVFNPRTGFYPYRNQLPLPANRLSRRGHHGPPRTPARPIPEHVEDARPLRAAVPLHHPLRIEIVRLRELRVRVEALFQQASMANPRQSQDLNWKSRDSYEKEMKEICSQEFDLLESIERVQEGESYEEVNLDDEMLRRCLVFDEREKSRLSVNPDNAWRPLTYGHGSGHTVQPSHPQQSMFPNVSCDTALPSIERDSDDEDGNIARQTGEKSTQPSHAAAAAMPPKRQEFLSMPLRPAYGGMAPPSAANQRSFILPPVPVLSQGMDASRHHTQQPRRAEMVDLTAEGDHARATRPMYQPSFGGIGPMQPSTPKIRLTARALAAKRLREASTTPLGKHVHPKRQKLAAEHQQIGVRRQRVSEIEKFRNDPAVKGREMPEHAVVSGDEDFEDQDDGEEGDVKIASV